MDKTRKILLMTLLTGLVLGGCNLPVDQTDKSQIMEENVVNVSGVIQNKTGDEWVFLEDNGDVINITSQKLDLSSYMGKKISISGMFSGSTLYVDKID